MAAIYAKISKVCQENGFDLRNYINGNVLEVGTGRIATMANVLFVLGARSVFTIDVEQQYKPSLTKLAVANNKIAHRLLEGLNVSGSYEELIGSILHASQEDLIDSGEITYMAPVPNIEMEFLGHFDFQLSYTVLEHVETNGLINFFDGLKSCLSPNGLSVHYIDFLNHTNAMQEPFGHLKKNVITPKSSEKSCGVPLGDILDAAGEAGLNAEFCHKTTLNMAWKKMVSDDMIATNFLENEGVVTAVVGFRHG